MSYLDALAHDAILLRAIDMPGADEALSSYSDVVDRLAKLEAALEHVIDLFWIDRGGTIFHHELDGNGQKRATALIALHERAGK